MQYKSLREKIAAEKIERQARHANFLALYQKARSAGIIAGQDCVPRPMIVSGGGKQYYCEGGACGFAYVKVTKANAGFGHWLLQNNLAYKAYNGGAEISISDFGQSVERKLAMASAMAEIFRQAGVQCYSSSRLD